MKKLALVLFAGISFATAHAQVQFGVKAGANFATQTGSDAGDSKTLFNFNAGAFLRLAVVQGFSIQPELVYSGQGASYDVSGGTLREHANYLNIPVLFKWSHRAGPYFETGPQLGFILSAKASINGNSTDSKSAYNSTDFAWVFGVGYKIPRSPVGIDLRYNIGIANVEDRGVTGQTGSWRNDVVQLGLTYVLFNGPRR
ncbi:MAG TPA: porin family protein [Puia sp.]|nr:porin family protein [Puia sp.]